MPRGQPKNPKHPIDRGAPASVIADRFGGMAEFATAIGRSPSTVHRWLVKGYIDGRYHGEILEVARTKGVKLKPADFVDNRKRVAAPVEAAA